MNRDTQTRQLSIEAAIKKFIPAVYDISTFPSERKGGIVVDALGFSIPDLDVLEHLHMAERMIVSLGGVVVGNSHIIAAEQGIIRLIVTYIPLEEN